MPVYHGLYLGMNAKPIQDIYSASDTEKYPLASFFDDEWGRRFRYAKAGSGALVAGNIVQSAPLAGAATTLQSAAVVNTVAAAGTTRIYLTAVTTGQAAGLYDDGWAAIWDADLTAVYTRQIKQSGALSTTGPTDTNSYIELYEPIPVELNTSDRVALSTNLYKNIIVTPTTVSGKILGGVHCAVPANNYCWVQTKGIFGFRLKDVTVNCQAGPLAAAGTTAGSLVNAVESDSGAVYKTVVGISNALWLDEYAGQIWLNCE